MGRSVRKVTYAGAMSFRIMSRWYGTSHISKMAECILVLFVSFSSPEPPFLLVTWSEKPRAPLVRHILSRVALGTRMSLFMLMKPPVYTMVKATSNKHKKIEKFIFLYMLMSLPIYTAYAYAYVYAYVTV